VLRLVVRREGGDGWSNLVDMLKVPFRPFTAAYWLALLALLLFLGGALWAIEGWNNEEDFPFKGCARGLFDGCFRMGQCFFGCNDHRVHPFSPCGRALLLASSFCMLVLTAQYTARVTSFLVAKENEQVASLDAAIARRFRFCVLEAVADTLAAGVPKLASALVRQVSPHPRPPPPGGRTAT